MTAPGLRRATREEFRAFIRAHPALDGRAVHTSGDLPGPQLAAMQFTSPGTPGILAAQSVYYRGGAAEYFIRESS